MKRCSRKPHTATQKKPSVDELRNHMQALADQHHEEWSLELAEERPEWIHMLALHLRMVELEHLEGAVEELL